MRTTISTTTTGRHNKRIGTRIPVHIHLIFKNTHTQDMQTSFCRICVYQKTTILPLIKILRGEVRWWK